MNVGIALLCRVSSRRLPGKILREIEGRSLLEHILRRIHLGAPDCPVVVATSAEASDDPLEALCRRLDVGCFRGSLDDVAGRMLACAQRHGWDFVVRINGDNLFVDPPTLRAMLRIAATEEHDFVTNVPGRTFPYGLSVEILRTAVFAAALERVDDPGLREHVTAWFYENPEACRLHVFRNVAVPEAAGLQLAIDTPDDLARAGHILRGLGPKPETGALRDVARLAREWNAGHAPA